LPWNEGSGTTIRVYRVIYVLKSRLFAEILQTCGSAAAGSISLAVVFVEVPGIPWTWAGGSLFNTVWVGESIPFLRFFGGFIRIFRGREWKK
jgi:hypothetical protein